MQTSFWQQIYVALLTAGSVCILVYGGARVNASGTAIIIFVAGTWQICNLIRPLIHKALDKLGAFKRSDSDLRRE